MDKNNNKAILTIIVPSYNTFKHIDNCLPSFVDANSLGLYKVLLIDDGSNDGKTSTLLREYAEKYPHVFEYHYKENGGHGSVINYAVHNLISTPFFRVYDGDDRLVTGNFNNFLSYLYSCDSCDVIINDVINHNINSNNDEYVSGFVSETPNLFLKYVYMLPHMTFRTDIFKNNAIFLREHVFYDDMEYDTFALKHVKKVEYYPHDLYIINSGDSGQSTFSIARHYIDHLLVLEDIYSFYLKESKETPSMFFDYLTKVTRLLLRTNIIAFLNIENITFKTKTQYKKRLKSIIKGIGYKNIDYSFFSKKDLLKSGFLSLLFFKLRHKSTIK